MDSLEKEPMLAAVWLLATLSGDRGISSTISYRNGLKNKKAVTNINITETCRCIIEVSDKIPLRRTSNLMFGTVLAYKKKCLLNWRDVNSCRMLLQRLNSLTNSSSTQKSKYKNTSGLSGTVNKGNPVKLLQDDPFFDISQGLIADWIDVGKNAIEDWKVKEFQSMDTKEGDEVAGDHDNDDDDVNLKHKQGEDNDYSQMTTSQHTQSENWEELNFEFDENGEIINPKAHNENRDNEDVFEQANQTAGVINIDESDIHRSLSDKFGGGNIDFGGFDDVFDHAQFEPPIMQESLGEEDRRNVVSKEKEIRSIKNGPQKKRKKCLVIDDVVMLSSASIKKIRDGYIDKEHNILESRYIHRVEMNILALKVNELTDSSKYYKQFNNPYQVNENNDARNFREGNSAIDFGDPFDNVGMDVDIEYGRKRARSRSGSRSRSSSVSSVEQGRRTSVGNGDGHRHSSSFHFDFDNQIPDMGFFGALGEENDGDIARLDISLGDSDGESNRAVVGNVEEFLECVPEEGGNFSEFVSESDNSRAERAAKFMHVLQLATNGRVKVRQEEVLFGEIWVERAS